MASVATTAILSVAGVLLAGTAAAVVNTQVLGAASGADKSGGNESVLKITDSAALPSPLTPIGPKPSHKAKNPDVGETAAATEPKSVGAAPSASRWHVDSSKPARASSSPSASSHESSQRPEPQAESEDDGSPDSGGGGGGGGSGSGSGGGSGSGTSEDSSDEETSDDGRDD